MLFPGDPDYSMEEARGVLGPYHGSLRDVVLSAAEIVNATREVHPRVGKAYEYMATRQKVMNSLVVEGAKEWVVGTNGGVNASTENGFLELRIAGTIDLRFKQIDENGHIQNYPTAASQLYRNQLPLIGVQTTLDCVRLTLGWRWDAAATEIADIQVVFAKGDYTEWSYSIMDAADGTATVVATVPDPDGSPEPDGPRSPRMSTKKSKKKGDVAG